VWQVSGSNQRRLCRRFYRPPLQSPDLRKRTFAGRLGAYLPYAPEERRLLPAQITLIPLHWVATAGFMDEPTGVQGTVGVPEAERAMDAAEARRQAARPTAGSRRCSRASCPSLRRRTLARRRWPRLVPHRSAMRTSSLLRLGCPVNQPLQSSNGCQAAESTACPGILSRVFLAMAEIGPPRLPGGCGHGIRTNWPRK
jgi:hypothetical protein